MPFFILPETVNHKAWEIFLTGYIGGEGEVAAYRIK